MMKLFYSDSGDTPFLLALADMVRNSAACNACFLAPCRYDWIAGLDADIKQYQDEAFQAGTRIFRRITPGALFKGGDLLYFYSLSAMKEADLSLPAELAGSFSSELETPAIFTEHFFVKQGILKLNLPQSDCFPNQSHHATIHPNWLREANRIADEKYRSWDWIAAL